MASAVAASARGRRRTEIRRAKATFRFMASLFWFSSSFRLTSRPGTRPAGTPAQGCSSLPAPCQAAVSAQFGKEKICCGYTTPVKTRSHAAFRGGGGRLSDNPATLPRWFELTVGRITPQLLHRLQCCGIPILGRIKHALANSRGCSADGVFRLAGLMAVMALFGAWMLGNVPVLVGGGTAAPARQSIPIGIYIIPPKKGFPAWPRP
jgi:hypothetical protein